MSLTKITKPEVAETLRKTSKSVKTYKKLQKRYCCGITWETQLPSLLDVFTVMLTYQPWCSEIHRKCIQQINEFGQNCCTVPSETKSTCLNTAEELLRTTPLLVVNTVAVFDLQQQEEIKRNMPQAVEVNCGGSRKNTPSTKNILWVSS